MANALYWQQDNGAIYVFLDGGLRWLPSPEAVTTLLTSETYLAQRILFANTQEAPFPILSNFPIIDGARLVNLPSQSSGQSGKEIFLTDKYPWDSSTVVLRHLISTDQANEIGFDLSKVIAYQNREIFGVPLSIFSNKNLNVKRYLEGYKAVYSYFYDGDDMNPQFNFLLTQFPNQDPTGYKPELKALIAWYQQEVDNLPNS